MSTYEPWNEARGAEIIAEHDKLEGATLVILHAMQEAFGYVPEPAIPMIAAALNLSRAEVHGVFTFYHDFRHEPAGRHVLKLCRAEACQAAGGDALAARAEARLGIAHRKHHGRLARDAGADLLPRPVRHRAVGDARWPRGRTARRSAPRCAGRGGAAMTMRIFVPRDAGAVAVGADEVALGARAGRRQSRYRRRDRQDGIARALLAGADGRGRDIAGPRRVRPGDCGRCAIRIRCHDRPAARTRCSSASPRKSPG